MAIAFIAALFVITWWPDAGAALDPEVADDAADFPNYYFGGERWLDGEPIYDPLTDEVRGLFGIGGYDTYPADPPPTIVLFSPFSIFGYEAAWWIWQVVSLGLVVASVVIVAKEVGYSAPVAAVIGAAALLTSPVRFLLVRNHMESLLLFLGVIGWLGLRRGMGTRAAAWWGVAAGLKLFPGMWLVGMLDRRRSRAALTGLGVALGLVVAGGLAIGLDNVEAFVTEVIPESRRWYGVLGNYSLVSVGSALVAPWLGWVLTAVALVVLLPRYLGRPSGPDRTLVLGTALALLVSPLSWLNYLVLAIPALLVLSKNLDLRGRAADRIMLAALVVALLAWGPVTTDSELVSELVSFVPTYAMLGLFLIAHRRIEEVEWVSTSATRLPPTS